MEVQATAMPDGIDQQPDTGPLQGVRVLDFTRILSGPYCSLLLRDLGADVIKVEKTGSGDDTRQWGPPFLEVGHGTSTYFAPLTGGNRSFALNCRSPFARGVRDA